MTSENVISTSQVDEITALVQSLDLSDAELYDRMEMLFGRYEWDGRGVHELSRNEGDLLIEDLKILVEENCD